MPYFAVREKGHSDDIYVIEEETIENVERDKEMMFGPGNWVVREITEEKAKKWLNEYARYQEPRGEIVTVAGTLEAGTLEAGILKPETWKPVTWKPVTFGS